MAKDYNDYYPLGLNHKTGNIAIYDPVAVPYNYKFQEQELQETGFYAFKWRNYDPSMGRFFNVDPLSEKYAYQSHYNFSENRLTDGRELEGLERIDINGDFMDYQEAAEFARNTGSYFNFRDGEIPEIWKDIQEVVIQGGNREARSSSDQNDAAMASNNPDAEEFLESIKNMGPEPGARGMVSLDPISVPYMLLQAGITSVISNITGSDEGDIYDDVGLAMLLFTRKPTSAAEQLNIVKQTPSKVDYLFSNRNQAMNWGRKQLGHNTEKMFDESGKWIGWQNSKGKVYWGHGDWGKGVGSSTFPHLNYNMTGGTKGHLFLENKIKNRGMWDDFINYFNK